MTSHHHFKEILDCFFGRWVKETAAEVYLPGKLVCNHHNRSVLGLPGRGKPAHETYRDDFPRMPSNDCVDVDVVRQFVSC